MGNYWEEEPYIEPGIYDEIFAEAVDKIKESLNGTVKAYINENAKELARAEETIKSLRERCNDLTKQVADTDKIREQVKTELLKTIWDDVNPGDYVWLIRTENLYKKCEVCNGKRKVKATMANGTEVGATCPYCEYGGVKVGVKRTAYSKELQNITRTVYKDGNKITFSIGGSNYKEDGKEDTALCVNWNKENVFRTKEEAEAEIERLDKIERGD